jgi:hypothetical protein
VIETQNKATPLAEGSVRSRSDLTSTAVPLYQCVAQLHHNNAQIGSYGRTDSNAPQPELGFEEVSPEQYPETPMEPAFPGTHQVLKL